MKMYECIFTVKVFRAVTPAEAGVQKTLERLDSRLRGNDRKECSSTSYELIKRRAEIYWGR